MPVEWVTFDCYGTLIDWERGITDALLPLLPAGTDRRALAEWYIEMEAQFEAEGFQLYREVLDRVGRRVLRSLDAPIPDDQTSPLPSAHGTARNHRFRSRRHRIVASRAASRTMRAVAAWSG